MLCCILFLSGFLLLAFAKRTLFHCFLPYRFRHLNSSYQKPTIMVTNDVGIDTPWLRSLVRVLVSTNLFHVLVCAPDSEKSAFSHCITWRHPISAQRVVIEGATAFAVSDHAEIYLLSGRKASEWEIEHKHLYN
ncbi:uncharacterized protein LOC110610594 [Manihot esculenta]|uniref:uncharacterized protein LOC110610594 n=1 Tax=Manihot esculenta TaxID=3983 RepID=UPI000B5D893B|nr:uncharacterized protein LOC110610594 [Manihot esculenta]